MASADQEKKDLWVGWTHDALAAYVAPDDVEDHDEAIDDMIDAAVDYADGMLDEFEKRFSGGAGRRRSKKKKKPALDPDDDDDDD